MGMRFTDGIATSPLSSFSAYSWDISLLNHLSILCFLYSKRVKQTADKLPRTLFHKASFHYAVFLYRKSEKSVTFNIGFPHNVVTAYRNHWLLSVVINNLYLKEVLISRNVSIS